MLVLSIFPGIGMLDRAFAMEGFQTVRGSDPIWGGDIRDDHYQPGKFDGVIGGPPCQSFSSLVHLVRANGHEPRFGNLIPEYERVVAEAQPAWFLMENVPAAPVPVVAGYGVHSFELDNSMLPGPDGDGFGQEQRRVRRFSFGLRGREPVNLMQWIELAVFVLPDVSRAVTKLGPDHLAKLALTTKRRRKQTVVAGGTLTSGAQLARDGKRSGETSRAKRLVDACRLQGLPEDFLKDSPLTADGKLKAVANGVPIPMGRAIAKAIKEAINSWTLP